MSEIQAAGDMLIISVTNWDVGTMERDGERIYVTGTAPSLGRVRVWMGPESYQSLLDAVRQDGVVWCEVPREQVATHAGGTGGRGGTADTAGVRWPGRSGPACRRGPVPGRSGGRARLQGWPGGRARLAGWHCDPRRRG